MKHQIEWTEKFDKALEEYFKEDVKGNSKHRKDYYDDDLPLMDINNFIVNLYYTHPNERLGRTEELIPPKWYGKVLEVLGVLDE